jgi:endonuclease YncB( thermonuclease family)
MKTLILAAALAALAFPALAEKPGKPARDCETKPLPPAASGEAYSIDGDTIAVVGLKPHIRLWGVQAAELRNKAASGATGIETVAGMVGRAELEDILTTANRKVHYEPTKWDRYCRIVAHVTAMAPKPGGDEIDVGKALLERGAAYGGWLDDAIEGKPELGKAYADAEARARQARAGLWPRWLGERKSE